MSADIDKIVQLSRRIKAARKNYRDALDEYNREVDACGDMGSNSHVDRYAPRRAQDELHGLEQEAIKLIVEWER